MKQYFLKHKTFKILLIILLIIFIIISILFLFLKLWIPFGEMPSNSDKENYLKRASNYKNGKFYNDGNFKMLHNDSAKNNFVSTKDSVPKDEIPIVSPTYLYNPTIDTLNITWFGHSTILMQMHGMNILIDPVFSSVASPVSFVGSYRFSNVPIEIEELPNIDIVVISHDHYDHLDYNTIKALDDKVDKYIVPLGIENHLEKWNVKKDKIINLAWWEETNINGLTIACTPARHYSGRKIIDNYNTLWASWVFMDEYYKVFESGDTGFGNHFEEIYNRYGNFDLAMLDSGQYDVKWREIHMTPEDAVKAGKILSSKMIMPIHWGTFKLAKHAWDDPPERFSKESEKENIKYIIPKIGETVTYSGNIYTEKWWKEIR